MSLMVFIDKMKKTYSIIIIVIAVLIVAVFFIRFILGGNEDSWIKDEKGVYVKHGAPSETPEHVAKQQDAVSCALNLYQQKKTQGMQFSSQCLGTCGNFVVDIVNVPRNEEDNKVENQCSDYRAGKASHFIELDKNGEIVRIA